MRIKRKFLKLTKRTYPHGTESLLKPHLPKGYKEDGLGNYYLLIGDKPSTMFACHLDTACKESKDVKHTFVGSYIYTDRTTILGADDKAGMVVLLSLIEKNIPGLYYFFIGEEVGCIGSTRLSNLWSKSPFSKHITKVISFDRKGTDSIITDQLFGTCCSNQFANELAKRLNDVEPLFYFKPDPTGVFTDSAKFMDLVPECTNISVGYYDEHTFNERQDIIFLGKLCKAVVKVDWETLPVKRDPDDVEDYFYSERYFQTNTKIIEENKWSMDYFSFFTMNGSSKKMYISTKQIKEEVELIENWLLSSCSYPGFRKISWNGNSLYVDIEYMEHVGNRKDLIPLIPKLTYVPISQLKNEDELYDMFIE
jgi:hypothetical protein